MNIAISNTSEKPIYQQLFEQISAQIFKGELESDNSLPPIRQAATELHVRIITVKKAWEELERCDLIYTITGKGCFVTEFSVHFHSRKQGGHFFVISIGCRDVVYDKVYIRPLLLLKRPSSDLSTYWRSYLMKLRIPYIITFLALSMIINGCSISKINSMGSPSPSVSSLPISPESTSEAYEIPSISVLEEFMNQSLANVPAEELRNSLKRIIKEVPPLEADEFIRAMEDYYEAQITDVEENYATDKVQSALTAVNWPFTEDQISIIEDATVRSLVEKTLNDGYKLETTEGYIFPIVDYSKLLAYGERLTTPMRTYLDLMAMESDAKTASDGGLVISLEELSNRLLAAESYVVNFPDSPERTKAENRYIQYLNYYLLGLDNSPIYDSETLLVIPEVRNQFDQMATSHAGTITGQLTLQLLAILNETANAVYLRGEEGELIVQPELTNFQEKLELIARSKLPQVKNK